MATGVYTLLTFTATAECLPPRQLRFELCLGTNPGAQRRVKRKGPRQEGYLSINYIASTHNHLPKAHQSSSPQNSTTPAPQLRTRL